MKPQLSEAPYHLLHPSVLREYDIRGVFGETIFEPDYHAIGRAYGSAVIDASGKTSPVIAVLRDGRLSSPALAAALIRGLASTGARVIDGGVGPTPMCYFALYHFSADACCMVTGSHNPPTHNGIKFMLGKASFFGEQIRALGERTERGEFHTGPGDVRSESIQPHYIKALIKKAFAKSPKALSVVWDPGNGAAGDVVSALVTSLPGQHAVINAAIDGTFPNHHPDPSVAKNLVQLQQEVARRGAQLGLAFDGDADRVGVVDERGQVLSPDHLLMLFARDVLTTSKGTVIGDVKTSQAFFDDVATHGGTPLMWKTGHSHIKTKMKEIAAPFGGEASGHIFFADRYFGFDDGIYAALRMMDIVARSGKKLSELVSALPQPISSPEFRITCEESKKFAIIEALQAELAREGANVNTIDGVRVSTSDGWWLIRASNTQAALIARAEASSEAALTQLVDVLKHRLAAHGVSWAD